jgi:hypothetical protein
MARISQYESDLHGRRCSFPQSVRGCAPLTSPCPHRDLLYVAPMTIVAPQINGVVYIIQTKQIPAAGDAAFMRVLSRLLAPRQRAMRPWRRSKRVLSRGSRVARRGSARRRAASHSRARPRRSRDARPVSRRRARVVTARWNRFVRLPVRVTDELARRRLSPDSVALMYVLVES